MPAVGFAVWGEVQRVGYRAFVARHAAELGLRGWVRNREDGVVEGVAIGEAAGLGSFRQALEQGPVLARVRRVEMHPLEMSREELAAAVGFRIDAG